MEGPILLIFLILLSIIISPLLLIASRGQVEEPGFPGEVGVAGGGAKGKISVKELPSLTVGLYGQPGFQLGQLVNHGKPQAGAAPGENALVVKKGSKIRGRFSGAMPQPKSWTEIVHVDSRRWPGIKNEVQRRSLWIGGGQDHLVRDRWYASAALKMKFKRICWIKSLEAETLGQVAASLDAHLHLAAEICRPASRSVSSHYSLRSQIPFSACGIAAEPQHGLHNPRALVHHHVDPIDASANFFVIIQVVLDDLRGAFDDG